MNRKAIFAALSLMLCGRALCAAGSGEVRCEVVAAAGKATAGELRRMLLVVGTETCRNNAEFSEISNEWLFDVIEKQPGLFFEVLFQMNPDAVARVRKEIDGPVHDCMNVERRARAVEAATMPERLKRKALEVLAKSRAAERELIEAWERRNSKKWACPD